MKFETPQFIKERPWLKWGIAVVLLIIAVVVFLVILGAILGWFRGEGYEGEIDADHNVDTARRGGPIRNEFGSREGSPDAPARHSFVQTFGEDESWTKDTPLKRMDIDPIHGQHESAGHFGQISELLGGDAGDEVFLKKNL